MSTIEKALGRLQSESAAAEPEATEDTIERAGSPAPATATGPAGPTAGAMAGGAGGLKIDIPFDVLHSQGFLTPTVPRSVIAEEFRAIKRPLLKNISGQTPTPIKNANLIMVTSALQGDGKTFTSLNLAMSIAMEQDKTVLYVDADVLKATAGHQLGIPAGTPGLIDVLRDEHIALQDVILHTSMPKLRVLAAGTPDAHATELLASESMHQLMLELSARYHDRVIVFDSPPLLLTNEAGVLASFMGQVVFVAGADFTPQHAVQEALERIGQDKMVGMVLNRASRRRIGLFGKSYGFGGYGYGYGYGYGGGEGERAQAADLADQAAGRAQNP
ncbi:exopolysaccharide biosynthesis protein [Kineobactrum sediminis]|uniref:non-specific protein-tyrosine kinase n=1 Tax=Kineobactrum sediminis TaxID=1905677 RepID=A0A2N5XZH0_9GAMM|nr:XrtA-associated tyrosine autokinase [Kineobactrum sediminis]PLW81536.1 exopolysaccharide biosynthesis protein [Kineobactrum sediminis]